MKFSRDDPSTWPVFRPLIIAHDVGRSRDRSTAVVGGNSPFEPRLLGIEESKSCRKASMAARAPARWLSLIAATTAMLCIVADLSNDPSYAEVLHETFGPRVIGLQISRYGDGMNFERRPVKHSAMLVYTIGRSYLLELFHAQMQSDQVRIVDGPKIRRAYEQLAALETEMRDSGMVYSCPPGQHDDLGISCAMLAWAAQHPHG